MPFTIDSARGIFPETLSADAVPATIARFNQLKAEDRMVLQLLDLEQKTLAEVGELTGWNITLIKVRAFRARRKLQKLFEELKKKERA